MAVAVVTAEMRCHFPTRWRHMSVPIKNALSGVKKKKKNLRKINKKYKTASTSKKMPVKGRAVKKEINQVLQ